MEARDAAREMMDFWPSDLNIWILSILVPLQSPLSTLRELATRKNKINGLDLPDRL